VGTDPSVVLPPTFELLTCILQREEDLDVQALVPEPAVERLDEGVLDRLARADKVELDAVRVRQDVRGAGRAGEEGRRLRGRESQLRPDEGPMPAILRPQSGAPVC